MRNSIFVGCLLASFWIVFDPSISLGQSKWRLYDPKTAIVPLEDLINGAANRLASDSMRLEFKSEAIARAKYAAELERRAKLDDLIQTKQGEVLGRCVEENSALNLKVEGLEEDIDSMRPWMVIGKTLVITGGVALVGWTTVSILNAAH